MRMNGIWTVMKFTIDRPIHRCFLANGNFPHLIACERSRWPNPRALSIQVTDQSYPVAVINGGGNIVRGFGESFTLASSSTDNFGIDREEWWADETSFNQIPGLGIPSPTVLIQPATIL